MTAYERKRASKSQYIKYDKLTKTWIQHRKVIYLYWFKYLQHAEADKRFTVNWDCYESWGGRETVLSSKFDQWWKLYWRRNFGFSMGRESESLFFTKVSPQIVPMRTSLFFYENKHKGDKWQLACLFANEEKKIKKRVLPDSLKVPESLSYLSFYLDSDSVDASFDLWQVDTIMSYIIKKIENLTRTKFHTREIEQPIMFLSYAQKSSGNFGNKSKIRLVQDDDSTRTYYNEYQTLLSDLNQLRNLKRRVQGFVSRYLKKSDDYLAKISNGGLD